MSFADVTQIIRERFNTQWQALSPTYLHFFAGVPITRDQINNRPWVRVTIQPGETRQVGFSNSGRRKRTVGNIVVQVFVPAGEGDGLAQELADRVASIWEMSTIQGVIFRATSVQRVGEDGAWLQYNTTTPFQADALVTE